MAIKVSEVVDILNNSVDTELLEKVENKIDKELSNPRLLASWRCGTEEYGYFWRVGGDGELNEATKKALTAMYVEQGWESVTVINSSENGERPGAHIVVLCLPPGTKIS